MTDLPLQSSNQQADKMVQWVGVIDAKLDDPGTHTMESQLPQVNHGTLSHQN